MKRLSTIRFLMKFQQKPMQRVDEQRWRGL
jgi:hypothetical protein